MRRRKSGIHLLTAERSHKAFKAGYQSKSVCCAHFAKCRLDMLPELSEGGVLQLLPAFRYFDEHDPSILDAFGSFDHAAGFQRLDCFRDRGRLEIHSPGNFSHGDLFALWRENIQKHKLRGAESGLVKVIKIGRLYGLADSKPCREKPCEFRLAEEFAWAAHGLILPESGLSVG